MGFRPRELLATICQIYLHLYKADLASGRGAFAAAISRDGRSYKEGLFDAARDVLAAGGMLTSDELTLLVSLSQAVKDATAAEQEDEEMLGEVPDDFCDPIMGHLMTDPVVLPTSGVSVDRATIQRHLLSDLSDPYNRKPLTIDEVKPDVELKARIDAWVAERRKEARQG